MHRQVCTRIPADGMASRVASPTRIAANEWGGSAQDSLYDPHRDDDAEWDHG
jgi:hypothetical protein